MMVRKTAGVMDRIEALNVLGNDKIKGYEEQNDEDGKEKEDVELKESISQGVENEKEDKKGVKMSKKQRRNQVLQQMKKERNTIK